MAAPGLSIVMVPLWGPTVRALGFTATLIEPALLPVVEAAPLSVSHVLFEDAVHVNVPGPPLETIKVCGVGAVPLWTAENDIVVGIRTIVGVVTAGLGSS